MKIIIEGNTIDGSARSTLNVILSGARGPQGPQGEAGASEWGDIGGTLSEQTDLQAALDAKVPYTGATQDVNLGEFGLLTGNLEFDTTPTNAPTAAGSMYYDDTSGTVVNILKGGNVISKIGETQHVRVYNNTGAPIAKGKVVAINGAQGQRPTIILADADSETLSKDTIGFTAEAIADGAEGFVMIAGMLTNVSTSGMVDGDTVYLSTTAGSYTNVKPEAPVHIVILGFVVNGSSGGAGQIYVKVDNGYELEELHNVKETAKTTAVDADALLLKDSADSNLWKPFSWLNAKSGIKAHMDTFKGVAGGYASLDGGGKVPASELPSYVDDVIEAANFAALPATGETGKIYVTLDNNKCYRWSGSAYIEISAGGGIDTLTTTGTSGAATLVGSTLNIPVYQSALTNPVTGTGTSGQVAYWNGTTTQTGNNNLFWDNTNGRLGYQTVTPLYLADFLQTSTQALAVNSISNAIGRSFFFGYDTGTARRGIQIGTRSTGSPFIQPIDGASAGMLEITGFGGYTVFSAGIYGSIASYGKVRIIQPDQGVQLGLFGFNVTDNLIRLKAASGQTGDLIQFRDSSENVISKFDSVGSLGLGFSSANSARLHVRGSGTTSATTALLVQNSTPAELFKITDDGVVSVGATQANTKFTIRGLGNTSATKSLSLQDSDGNEMAYISNGSRSRFTGLSIFGTETGTNAVAIYSQVRAIGLAHVYNSDFNIYNDSSGQTSIRLYGFQHATKPNTIELISQFTPTSGSVAYSSHALIPTINQTGGANGITRGLYVNPTLTAAADWRSIETSNNTGYAAYFAGSADLFLGNGTDIQIGTTTGTKIGTATSQKLSFWNATPIVQPTTAIAEAAFVENSGGTAVNVDSTFAGYTIQQIAQALKDIGILA